MSAVRLFAALAAVFVASPALAGSITISGTTTDATYSSSSRVYSCPGTNCTIAPATLMAELAGGAVTVAASGESGDVVVGEALTWTGSVLTLSAARNVNIAATVTHSGTGSGLVLRADSECRLLGGITAAASSISGNTTAYTHDASVTGTVMASGTLTMWKLIDSTAELALLPATGDFALGCDMIDPGGYASIPTFGGRLDGLGHAVINLRVAEGRGMFTLLDGATVTNLVLVRPNVTYSSDGVGALAGSASGSRIADVAVIAGSVSSSSGTGVGGLIGAVSASEVARVYTSGTVNGGSEVGGVLGSLDGSGLIIGTSATLSDAMSRATVTGGSAVGGLVGASGRPLVACSVVDSWAAGAVTGMSGAGGAVGTNAFCTGTSVYWDTTTSRQAASAIGTGRTNAQMKRASSFSGFDLAGTWLVREDVGRPFLRSMQRLLDANVAVVGTGSTFATQTATFTGTVTLPAGTINYEPSNAPVTGPIRFLDGATLIDATSLAAGSASVSTSALSVGDHTINVIYDGNDYHVENSSSVSHAVLKASTTIAIENAAGPINATVTPLPPASGVPTGNITFNVDDGRTFVVAMASGIATLNPSQLGAGDYLVSATYGGDASFDGSGPTTAIAVHVVGPTETALGQSIATTELGEAFDLNAVVTNIDANPAVPTGTVRFVADNVTLLAEVTLSAGVAATSISTLSGGTHVIVAQYIPADPEEFTTSVSPPITHEVTKAATSTNLVVADIHDGYVTLNIDVSRANALLPAATGEVTITIDGVDVGDPTLVDGAVSFDSDQLPRGTHTISARYDGDANYEGSVSAELEVNVELEGFRFVATPRKGTTFAGGSVPVTLSLTPENGTFTEQVTFSCENLPPGVTCVFSPVAVGVAPAGTTVGLLINTQRPVAAAGLTLPRMPPMFWLPLATLAAGAYLLTRRRKAAYLTLALLAVACGSSGGDNDPTEGTPPGTYTVTVRAQGQTIFRTTTVEIEVR